MNLNIMIIAFSLPDRFYPSKEKLGILNLQIPKQAYADEK